MAKRLVYSGNELSQQFWDRFDTISYVRDFYMKIFPEDRLLLLSYEKFFRSIPPIDKAVEVGTGPNLYPIMAALPYVEKIEAIEFSRPNIHYIKTNLKNPDENWYGYWKLLQRLNKNYRINLKDNLHKRVAVVHGSIYFLPEEKYDLAIMQTCAESITSKHFLFKQACLRFIRCVKRGGFFLATFVENSEGYNTNGIVFPALKVDKNQLEKIFSQFTSSLKIDRIPKVGAGYKEEGYTGLLVLTARRK